MPRNRRTSLSTRSTLAMPLILLHLNNPKKVVYYCHSGRPWACACSARQGPIRNPENRVVAQLVERTVRDREAEGSSPSSPTNPDIKKPPARESRAGGMDVRTD